MTIKTIPAVQARIHLGAIMKRAFKNGDHYIVEKSGIPMVAILNANEYMQIVQEREERFKILKNIKAKIPFFPPEEVEEDVRRAVKDIRKKHA